MLLYFTLNYDVVLHIICTFKLIYFFIIIAIFMFFVFERLKSSIFLILIPPTFQVAIFKISVVSCHKSLSYFLPNAVYSILFINLFFWNLQIVNFLNMVRVPALHEFSNLEDRGILVWHLPFDLFGLYVHIICICTTKFILNNHFINHR